MEAAKTALVLIDLQKGILSRPLAPRSGEAVIDNAARLLTAVRGAGGTTVLVRVGWHVDGRDRLSPPVDQPMPAVTPPAEWLEFATGIVPIESDLLIVKHQWGAVHGTDLDLQLRRRGIQTVIMGGVATNMGVESTARELWELGYQLIFAEDAMTSRTSEMHRFAVEKIFPLVGRVMTTDQAINQIRE